MREKRRHTGSWKNEREGREKTLPTKQEEEKYRCFIVMGEEGRKMKYLLQ